MCVGSPTTVAAKIINTVAALGLSLVHTNKTLRKLERRGLHALVDGWLHLRDVKAMVRLADVYGDVKPPPQPLV